MTGPAGVVRPRRGVRAACVALLLGACQLDSSDGAGAERILSDGESVANWAVTPFGGGGEITSIGGELILEPGSPLTGFHWAGRELPHSDYELTLTAARLEGTDFFCALTFPVGGSHGTLVLGGWGGSLCGLSCLDGVDASANETCDFRAFETGRRYRVRLRVLADRVQAWLDDVPLFDVDLMGRRVSLRPEVSLSAPLGIACFATRAAIGSIRLRPVSVGQ